MRQTTLAVALLVLACNGPGSTPPPGKAEAQKPGSPTKPPRADAFVDGAASSGLDFQYENGGSGKLYIHEIMGAGCGLFDYDNDGDLDAYLVQGLYIPPDFHHVGPPPSAETAGDDIDRLYRNDLQVHADGSRELSFTDVTAVSGIVGTGYGMGVTTGDYDNDGWMDLYVTNFGANRLYRNNGDGTFEDATEPSGTSDDNWSVNATFFDYDRDGWLDLFVANYVSFSHQTHRKCFHTSGAEEYCGPIVFPDQPDRLFHNKGDGTFEDLAGPLGISQANGAGLGTVAADFNWDGWPDLYVGNDGENNHLWMSHEGTLFTEEALLSGTAVDSLGLRGASMGVEAGDFDGDGDEDILVAHMNRETNTFYLNLGNAMFEDQSGPSGLGAPSRRHTTYAPAWLDYDNDGWLDLIAVNGAMQLINDWNPIGHPNPLQEPNQLFRNLGNGRFEDISDTAGEVFDQSESGRGAAVGDVDNDGDPDVLVTNNDGPTRLLLNQVGSQSRWLGLRLVGQEARRDMLGAYAEIVRPGGSSLLRRVATDGSYCSAKDPRILAGLGKLEGAPAVRVRWPSGQLEEWQGLEVGRYHTLEEGTGQTVSGPSLLDLKRSVP